MGDVCVGSQVGSTERADCSVSLDYDELTQRVGLSVCFPTEGCYHVNVAYRGVQLNNGDFDIVVLSSK